MGAGWRPSFICCCYLQLISWSGQAQVSRTSNRQGIDWDGDRAESPWHFTIQVFGAFLDSGFLGIPRFGLFRHRLVPCCLFHVCIRYLAILYQAAVLVPYNAERKSHALPLHGCKPAARGGVRGWILPLQFLSCCMGGHFVCTLHHLIPP